MLLLLMLLLMVTTMKTNDDDDDDETLPNEDINRRRASLAQVLTVSNERITVPELLFHPSDIGIEQAGVPECIVQSTEACLPDLRESLYGNIILTGGGALLPNFRERVSRELRELIPTDYEVGVSTAPDPLLTAWRGGSIFAASEKYSSQVASSMF